MLGASGVKVVWLVAVLLALIVLALLVGGVGLAVKSLTWLLIIAGVLILAAIVWGVVKRATLFARRR